MGHLSRRDREQRVGRNGPAVAQPFSDAGPLLADIDDGIIEHVRCPRFRFGRPNPKQSVDRRNCVGYAIREIYLGTASQDGKFHDLVRHTADPDQTTTYCSSVDPWHEPTGIDDKGDQVGLDLFYTSGYTRGLPAMIPVSMLYGTPEDSANQIAYLKARGYPHLIHRDGRRTRWPVHASGRLWRALPAMGRGVA